MYIYLPNLMPNITPRVTEILKQHTSLAFMFTVMIFRAIFLAFVICSFCGRDFLSLGRHSWRCKRRVVEGQEPRNTVNQMINVLQEDQAPITINTGIKHCCGKVCKGIHGLKMHQRSCKLMEGLARNVYGKWKRTVITTVLIKKPTISFLSRP